MADSSAHGERPPHHPDTLAAPDSSPLASRRATRVLSLLAGALVLTELALVGFASWQLWLAWQTAYEGYWQQLWRVLSALIGVAFVLVAVCLFGPFVAALRPFLQQVRAESERLVRLVAARTRLPLRDVSAVATRQGLGMGLPWPRSRGHCLRAASPISRQRGRPRHRVPCVRSACAARAGAWSLGG